VSGIWNIIVLWAAIPYNIVDKHRHFGVTVASFFKAKNMKAVCPSDDDGMPARGGGGGGGVGGLSFCRTLNGFTPQEGHQTSEIISLEN